MSFNEQSLVPEYVNQPGGQEDLNFKIDNLAYSLMRQGEPVNPVVLDYFRDLELISALPGSVRNDDKKLSSLLINMSKLQDLVGKERRNRNNNTLGLLGEEVLISETEQSDNRIRNAESGYKINLDYLKSQGVDPAQVLFFRLTQPSETPKPEYYWTSDYSETKYGLSREVSGDKRVSAVILVATLEVINSNGGLIQDINDDNGLSVRQIKTDSFDQSLALTTVRAK